MAVRVLQANINHCARAQDLLMQSAAQWLIDVVVVAEPYFIPQSDNWFSDLGGLAAIMVSGSRCVGRHVAGDGCVAVVVDGVGFLGVYFSPNRALAEFEDFLAEVDSLWQRLGTDRVVVAGDFNAKSTAWGSPASDARGSVLVEWAISKGLALLNRGTVETCERSTGGSIVDLSFTSPAVARTVVGWEVLVGVETLSDHRYIRFDLSSHWAAPGNPGRTPSGVGPRWSLHLLDLDLAILAALAEAWAERPTSETVDAGAKWFDEAMSRICDLSMPRSGPPKPRSQLYWWSAELARLRAVSLNARRHLSRVRRRRRQRNSEEIARLSAAYQEAKTRLRVAIAEAKKAAWEELLSSLNREPWGRPYRLVMSRLRPWAPPTTTVMEPELLGRVVAALFPARGPHRPPDMGISEGSQGQSEGEIPEVSEEELGVAVSRLQAKNKAPGPDGIPGKIWVTALKNGLEPRFRALLTDCLRCRQFPELWKKGKLVLLRKQGRPVDSPSAYRPVVLLSEGGKLLERILYERVVRHLGDVGPDLAQNQFGFRRARSTIDAVAALREVVTDRVSQGGVVVAVSLDIANAFNTLPWETIEAGLRLHGVPAYLRHTIMAYLRGRYIIYPTRDGMGWREVVCGVPQGSVLGPLLWNIGYDWVLRGVNPRGVDVFCYADDTLVTAGGQDFGEAVSLAATGVAQVVARIRALGLEVALHKSQAVCFHGPRRAPPLGSSLIVGGETIAVGRTIKYLGLVLDGRWSFKEHFRALSPKISAAALALSRLMPNIGGCSSHCRRLFAGVVRSMALYGSPIWYGALGSANRTLLRQTQRVIVNRAARAYRTVSYEAGCVLAGMVPWDLEAEALAAVFWRCAAVRRAGEPLQWEEVERWREDAGAAALVKWGERLESPQAGLRTVAALQPVLKEWVERRWGSLTYRLVQVLSGHGCFGSYLYRVARRETTPVCHECGWAEDTAQHTLEECPAWDRERGVLVGHIGPDLALPAVVRAMLSNAESWMAVSQFCEVVISRKEAAERAREEDVLADPIRRRRVGRRRRAYARLTV